jgi:hypothetical protein
MTHRRPALFADGDRVEAEPNIGRDHVRVGIDETLTRLRGLM